MFSVTRFVQAKLGTHNGLSENCKEKHDEKLTQLNLKVKKAEREAFADLCQRLNLSQREVFGILLANFTDNAAAQIIKDQSRVIGEQRKEIEKLCELPRGAKADIRLKQALSFAKQGIHRYIALLMQEIKIETPLMKCTTWNAFVSSFPNRRIYEYPKAEGFFTMMLEAICYGKGRQPAVFLWGVDIENGCYRKLRYYPKREYCGLSLPQNPYLHQGMLLLVGYHLAPDNAADLYVALPVIDTGKQRLSKAKEDSRNRKVSLDEIIRRSQI